MRLLQLAIGWLALCGLTAAGTYYAMIELDQQVGLQARIASHLAASVAPAPAGPTTPAPGPSTSTTTPVTPTPDKSSPPAGTPSPGTPSASAPPASAPAPSHATTTTPPPAAPTPTPVVQPIRRTPPPAPPADTTTTRRTPAPAPRVDLAPVQARYNDLYSRAKDLDTFFGNIEAGFTAGEHLKPELKNARSAMAQAINTAFAALHSGNADAATQALNLAQQKIEFLEGQK